MQVLTRQRNHIPSKMQVLPHPNKFVSTKIQESSVSDFVITGRPSINLLLKVLLVAKDNGFTK